MSAVALTWPSGEITVVANTEKGLVGIRSPANRRVIISEFSVTCGGTDPAALAARVRAIYLPDAQSGELSMPAGTALTPNRLSGLDHVNTSLISVGTTGVKDFAAQAVDANWLIFAEEYIHQQAGNWTWRPGRHQGPIELMNQGSFLIQILASVAIKVVARINSEE